METWYYAAGQEQKGPFTVEQIKGLLRDQVVNRDTYVWTPALSDWKPLAQTELAPLLSAGPPPHFPVAPPPGGTLAPAAGGPAFDFGAAAQGGGTQATFLRAVQTCLQQKYFNFQGRASRPEFWWYTLFVFALSIVAGIIDGILSLKAGGIGLLGLVVMLGTFLPSLGAAVRRLHDTNRSGLWYLIVLVPFVGWIVLLVFLCLPSDPAENQFGPPNPL